MKLATVDVLLVRCFSRTYWQVSSHDPKGTVPVYRINGAAEHTAMPEACEVHQSMGESHEGECNHSQSWPPAISSIWRPLECAELEDPCGIGSATMTVKRTSGFFINYDRVGKSCIETF